MPAKQPTDREKKILEEGAKEIARAEEEKAEKERIEREKAERERKNRESEAPKPVQFSKPTPEEERDDKAIHEIISLISKLFQTFGDIRTEPGHTVTESELHQSQKDIISSIAQEALLERKINNVKKLKDDPKVQKGIEELVTAMKGRDKFGDGRRFFNIDEVTGKIANLSHAVSAHLSGKTKSPDSPKSIFKSIEKWFKKP